MTETTTVPQEAGAERPAIAPPPEAGREAKPVLVAVERVHKAARLPVSVALRQR